VVAGERTPRAVGAVHAGRETDDQPAWVCIAESRYRGRVITGVALSGVLAEFGQPRAFAAACVEQCGSGRHGSEFYPTAHYGSAVERCLATRRFELSPY
jgi:hypothetical protein